MVFSIKAQSNELIFINLVIQDKSFKVALNLFLSSQYLTLELSLGDCIFLIHAFMLVCACVCACMCVRLCRCSQMFM